MFFRERRDFLHESAIDTFPLVEFGPVGSQLIYIVNGSIWYKPDATSSPDNLTDSKEKISNGIASFQYEGIYVLVFPDCCALYSWLLLLLFVDSLHHNKGIKSKTNSLSSLLLSF